ncbi:MAG TPA: hypothetical protein VE360_17925, partial [Pyrinomonadaceae bacterium]|nr:hypothetical protein [Pyrinomonadaceae bacterium]
GPRRHVARKDSEGVLHGHQTDAALLRTTDIQQKRVLDFGLADALTIDDSGAVINRPSSSSLINQ